MAEPSLKPLEPTGTIIDEFEDAFHSVCKYLDQVCLEALIGNQAVITLKLGQ